MYSYQTDNLFNYLTGNSLINSTINSFNKSNNTSKDNSSNLPLELSSSSKSTSSKRPIHSTLNSYHVYKRNQLNSFSFYKLQLVISILFSFLNDANCNSPPKIMPFHFNPMRVQEGDKALASK